MTLVAAALGSLSFGAQSQIESEAQTPAHLAQLQLPEATGVQVPPGLPASAPVFTGQTPASRGTADPAAASAPAATSRDKAVALVDAPGLAPLPVPLPNQRPRSALRQTSGAQPTAQPKFIIAQAPGAAAPAAPSGAPAPAGPTFEIRAFEVEGSTLISKAAFEPVLRRFIGPGKSFGDVQLALEAVERLFVSQGFGSVQVLLPEQELEQGTIKFKVVEPKVARILVEGNKDYSETNIKASLPGLQEGQAPNSNIIAANLRMANENPGKATTVLLRAGSNDGEVDAVVKVTEDTVTKFSYSFDNSGTDVTGRGASGNFRHGLGATYANVFGRDHVASAQVITSPQENRDFRGGFSKDVLIIGLSYRIPLYESGNMLDFTAGYSNVNSGAVQNIFTVSGRGSVFGVRLTQNLRRIGEYDHRLIYAADFRAYKNSVVAIGGGTGIVPDITVKPISLTYAGTYREPTAETNGYLSFNQNIPGGGNGGSGQWEAGTTATGTGQRPGGRPNYTLWRFGFSHYRAFANDWQARFNLVGQTTKDRLIPAEQFGLGGANSVRGFVERQFANDWGSYVNLEMYTPDFAPLIPLGNEIKTRLVFFHDYGHLVRNGPQTGDVERVTASGGGVGLRLSRGNSLSIKLDAAWANRPAHTGDTTRPDSHPQFPAARLIGLLVLEFCMAPC